MIENIEIKYDSIKYPSKLLLFIDKHYHLQIDIKNNTLLYNEYYFINTDFAKLFNIDRQYTEYILLKLFKEHISDNPNIIRASHDTIPGSNYSNFRNYEEHFYPTIYAENQFMVGHARAEGIFTNCTTTTSHSTFGLTNPNFEAVMDFIVEN